MRYLALIYSDEKAWAKIPEAEQGKIFGSYMEFTQMAKAAGVSKGGEALQPTATATTVRLRGGKTVTTDGPFAETKEALGGFYLFECKDLDEAVKWAAKIPGASYGCIEVRPIWEVGG